MKYTKLEEAIGHIKSGDKVYIHSAAMTPKLLIDSMTEQYKRLNNIELLAIITQGKAKYIQEPYNSSFTSNSFFVGANVRNAINNGLGTYTPVFLSEVHKLFEQNIVSIDVALVQVSPPDHHGYCSLGVSVDISLAAIRHAKKIIALINPQVPRSHGDGVIHEKQITAGVFHDEPIFTTPFVEPTDIERKIGENVAELIEDGATLQVGIGAIPNVVLDNLKNYKDLGIHTELFSDGILPLVESGVITGKHKVIKPEKIVTCFAMGSQKLYDFIDDNPIVHFKESSFTNNIVNIVKNPKVTAINSAIEVDLTGQVCADSIGSKQYSGVGGQIDFMRGASLTPGGKAIFAFSSRTNKGKSKIVSQLRLGAGVTTTRAHVHYFVTEYGAVNLFGKNIKERAKLLISIAHPEDREMLTKEAYHLFK